MSSLTAKLTSTESFPLVPDGLKVVDHYNLLHEFKKKTLFWKVDLAIETHENILKFKVVRKSSENTFIWR